MKLMMMTTAFFSVPRTLQHLLFFPFPPDSLMVTMYFWYYDVDTHDDDDAFLFLKTIPWLLYTFHNDDNDAFLMMMMMIMYISWWWWCISHNDDDDAFLIMLMMVIVLTSLFFSQFWWCFCTSQCFHGCYAFFIILMMMIHL